MRKILLGTTALVAAGLLGTGEAAAKFDVTVRGNYTAGYGFVNEDDDEGESGHTRQNQALNQDAEVHFRFEQTLDNGIIVGGRVELEGATHNEREGGSTGSRFSRSAGTDQIDEKWGYVRGGFGELRFGDEDDARKQKSYGAPEASGIFGVNSPYFTYNNTATGQVASTNSTFPNLENDSAKVIYFTPSFGGFQLAVSYAPDGTQDRAQARASISARWSAGSTMRTRARTTSTIPAGRPASASIWASDPEPLGSRPRPQGERVSLPLFYSRGAHSQEQCCDTRGRQHGNYGPRRPHNTLLRSCHSCGSSGSSFFVSR
jgi:hypothetical protein